MAGRLLRRVRDFASVEGAGAVDAKIADGALSQLEVDARGLDALDHRYLRLIAVNYGGGPVGVETIAAGLSEPRDAIEEIIEPYLLQQGFIARTPRGRVLTRAGLRPSRAADRRRSPRPVPACSTAATNERATGRTSRGGSRATRMCCRCASISRTPIAPASSITPTSSNSASAAARTSSGCSASTRTSLANPEAGEPAVFVVRHVEIDYLKPGRMDDVLEVVTRCVEIGSASLDLRQDVRRDETAASPARGHRRAGRALGQTAAPWRARFVNALQRFVNQPRET